MNTSFVLNNTIAMKKQRGAKQPARAAVGSGNGNEAAKNNNKQGNRRNRRRQNRRLSSQQLDKQLDSYWARV